MQMRCSTWHKPSQAGARRRGGTLAQELKGQVLMAPRRQVQDKGLLFPNGLSASYPASRPTVLGMEARSAKDRPRAEPQCLQ